MTTPISVGDRVVVRRQRWTVTDSRAFESCQQLTLMGTDTMNGGARQRVLLPFDIVETVRREDRTRVVGPARWRWSLRSLLGAEGSAATLKTAARARIDLLPHQLEPALAVVAGHGSRLLIADEVGLGKTIQAGLVLAELRARGAADRVLVLTPSGLREQWAAELAERFGIASSIADAREVRRQVSALAAGLNPWTTMPVAITSIDYIKRPEVLPAVQVCRWDLVIVDEAHGVAPDTDRHHGVSTLCGSAAYVILLTATPHSGDPRAFLSLCDLGARAHDRALVFRRSRSDVAIGPSRHVHRLYVRATEAEAAMHTLLGRFTRTVRQQDACRRAEVALTLTTLHKRALSSAYSLEASVRRRLASLSVDDDGARQLQLPLDDAGETDSADEPPTWAAPLLDDGDEEQRLLASLAESARTASRMEGKLDRLARLLGRLERLGESAIVFTEYRDTLLHVRDVLCPTALILHGGLDRAERRAAIADFVSGKHPLLLATDAAGQGLNLHHTCRTIINLELPWNPVRLEQRIGRVDRIGQQRTVHVFHLIARDAGEIRMLDRLAERVARARRDIASADPLGLSGDVDETASAPNGFTDSDQHVGRWTIAGFPTEADREYRRLVCRRRWLADRPPVDACPAGARPVDDVSAESVVSDPGLVEVLFARRRNLKMAVTGRMLVVLQTRIEDSCGRVVASHLTPLLVDPSRPIGRGDIDGLRQALRRLPLASVDGATASWLYDSLLGHERFWATRIARERAIEQAVAETAVPMFQSALFDRRTDREAAARAEALHEFIADTARRVAAAERQSAVHATLPRAVLMLLARRA